MKTRFIQFLGLLTLAATGLYGQPTNGAVYWSASAPDCSSLSGQTAVPITNDSGATIGYSCYVTGTFVWLASGGGWTTSIRIAAPALASVGVDYSFYDNAGNNMEVDTVFGDDTSVVNGSDVNFALYANQPAQVDLLGDPAEFPNYSSTLTGSAYVVVYCPDAATCSNVLPQLLYSALPSSPWSLSVPIAWDNSLWTQWSAEGIDDGGTNRVSLVVYNEDTVATSYTVQVFDSTGTLAGTGATPSIPPLPALPDGSYGQGGTYAALLSDVITTPLPSGIFKVIVDGGTRYSAVEVLQFNGPSATTLQVAYDTQAATATAVRRANVRRGRMASRPRHVFKALKRTK